MLGNKSCIMPECPYCPACRYGFINYPNFDPAFPEWVCLYDPARDREKLNTKKGGKIS